jgi:tRNA(adenine34) deaminase
MRDSLFMEMALTQADEAAKGGEVPVGAVVVKDGQVIASGRNGSIEGHDPTAHAEIMAIRAAARVLGNYRLDGCELFVTLEPCAMCSGAMLHARLARVVYGAPDPKTGAAGSVMDLFASTQINHQTEVRGGVMATECAARLQAFFQQKRCDQEQQRRALHPLRDDALRTPDTRFLELPDYPWQPNYISDLRSLAGLRMHYLAEGPAGAELTYLCLHGNPTWSYLYRKMIPVFLQAGHRVIAPDLIGFGRSDKPKKESAHSFAFHRQTLLELIERLDLRRVVLVAQDWGGLLGLTLPMEMPERFHGLVLMGTMSKFFERSNSHLSATECAAYAAPFPGGGHRAGIRALSDLVPDRIDADGAAISREARSFLQTRWSGKTLIVQQWDEPLARTASLFFNA